MESEPRATERRLHRVGVRLVAPVAAAAFIAEGLRIDDGARMAAFPTLLFAAPLMALMLTFLGAFFGFMIGFSPVGSLAGHGIAGPSIKRAARSVASVALSEARSPVWHSRSTTPSDNGFPAKPYRAPMRALAVVALVLLAMIAVGTIWNAGESHYRACVEAHVVDFGPPLSDTERGRLHLPNTPTTYTHATTSGCTRTPW